MKPARYCTSCWHRTWARQFMVRCQLSGDLQEYRDTCPAWLEDGDLEEKLRLSRARAGLDWQNRNGGPSRPQDDQGGQ